MNHKITDLISPEKRTKLIQDLKEAEKQMNGDPQESLVKKHWMKHMEENPDLEEDPELKHLGAKL